MSRRQEKIYPDTSAGAIKALREMSDYDLRGAKAIPDPAVEGVWMVILPREQGESGSDGKTIVYLAGYREPFGTIRRRNDFESDII